MSEILNRFRRTRLTDAQKQLLRNMLNGWTLKSHRMLDGEKAYRLHGLAGEESEVADATVEGLVAKSLLQSNLKFPAASYLLTEKGRSLAIRLAKPLG